MCGWRRRDQHVLECPLIWSQSEDDPVQLVVTCEGRAECRQNHAGERTNTRSDLILYSVEVQPQLPVLDDRRFSNLPRALRPGIYGDRMGTSEA